MSKAILVMDMPDSCDKCPLFGDHYSDMCCRGLNNRTIDYPYPENFRQEWCPLKSVPNYKRTVGKETEGNTLLLNCGWNDCIDEIMKGGADE